MLFPLEQLKQASLSAFKNKGSQLLQYNNTEGGLVLRNWITQCYQAKFLPVYIDKHGMNIAELTHVLSNHKAKLIYTIPNFQNPTGISYSEENRHAVAKQIATTDSYLIQDDSYGDLRFSGKAKRNFYSLLPQQTILLGSFSKTIAPALRLGWVVAPKALIKKR